MRSRLAALPLLLALPFTTGCINSMLTNGQISATRQASGSFDRLGDYEVARSGAMAGLVQFEGMHELAPDNEDALYLLLSGWVGYGYAFAEDDMEAAQDKGDDAQAEYHRKRARMAYERAVTYGLELLKHRDEGFEAAKRDAATMKAWLRANFDKKEDAENLYWVGAAWLSRVDIDKEDEALVADLFIGIEVLEQSMRLDPTVQHYGAMAALASYHARSPMGEMDQAKQMFEQSIAKTQHKTLFNVLAYGQRYACMKVDRPLYEKTLNEVVSAGDTDPAQRLSNVVAQRRAKRYLGKARMMDCGFDMSAPAAPPSSAPATPASAPPPAPSSAPPAPSSAPPPPAANAPKPPPAAPKK